VRFDFEPVSLSGLQGNPTVSQFIKRHLAGQKNLKLFDFRPDLGGAPATRASWIMRSMKSMRGAESVSAVNEDGIL
jgi:hypothetical protein